jgi:hypothetical protein
MILSDLTYRYTDREGYAIGYRDCDSNPTLFCYFFRNSLPYGGFTDVVYARNSSLPAGEKCTFFGCFQYTKRVAVDNCERMRAEIFTEDVTILGTCPDPGGSIDNGNVSFTETRTQDCRYVEETVVTVRCAYSYVPSYGGVSKCQRDGSWNTSSVPNCIGLCQKPDSIDGSSAVINQPNLPSQAPKGYYLFNTTVRVTCGDDHDKGKEIICGDGGNWSARLPQCPPIYRPCKLH